MGYENLKPEKKKRLHWLVPCIDRVFPAHGDGSGFLGGVLVVEVPPLLMSPDCSNVSGWERAEMENPPFT